MKKITFGLVIVASLVIVGCGGGSSSAAPDPSYNYTPALHSYHILDSYDTDTDYSNAPLALNPYLYYGLFEVYWTANSLEDYRVRVSINDRPSLSDSVEIHNERCGAGLRCDQGGSLICEYGANLTLSCDTSLEPVDISYLFYTIPEDLYLFLEVCDIDSPYCEYDYYPVTME
ncbi:MAG TPA: hypothetical protein VL987_12470 [Cellvibrio sp.]|nr:hypothetical protein [Cellvibrio sp.]